MVGEKGIRARCEWQTRKVSMSPVEKLADELGQIAFRIETNFYTLQRHLSDDAVKAHCREAITNDIERLKVLKGKLIEM